MEGDQPGREESISTMEKEGRQDSANLSDEMTVWRGVGKRTEFAHTLICLRV